jgi:hypothetical protein
MPTYFEYQLDDGTKILIEGPEDETGAIVKTAANGFSIADTKKKFSEALQGIKAQAKLLLKEIDDLHVEEAEIKFGISTAGELGMVIGKVGVGSNYEVTLKWKKPEQKK